MSHLKFSANLSFLFLERPFLERFAAARAAGFCAVEFHFPYTFAAVDIAAAARQAGVEVVLFNLPAGDWDAGERGIACDPVRRMEFQDGVGRAIEYVRALGCRQINCLAGLKPACVSVELARQTLVENLRFAADRFQREGLRLLLEPLNTRDTPGFFLSRSDQALSILDEAACDNLFLQYDVYHAQVMEGDLANTLERHLPRIGHIQIADNPGRHEPGSGEINYPFLFRHLERIGYGGWIGCEYKPKITVEAGLGWLEGLR